MKWIAFLVVALSFGANQNTPRFAKAQAEAATRQQPLLLIFSGSDWCRPCINFKRVVLDSPEFIAYADSNLVVFNADIPRDQSLLTKADLDENKLLASEYNEKGVFPYLILFNADGTILRTKPGSFGSFEALKRWIEK